jgi:hypothetical protein
MDSARCHYNVSRVGIRVRGHLFELNGAETNQPTNIMQRLITSLTQLAACLLFVAAFTVTADDKKVDPTGTWKWSAAGQNGQTRESTLKLKLDGDKLTGTISGRGGDTAIEQAKLSGEDISFQVTREINGNKVTAKYHGKVSGNTIKGKMETERDGQPRSRDWEAKKEAN